MHDVLSKTYDRMKNVMALTVQGYRWKIALINYFAHIVQIPTTRRERWQKEAFTMDFGTLTVRDLSNAMHRIEAT